MPVHFWMDTSWLGSKFLCTKRSAWRGTGQIKWSFRNKKSPGCLNITQSFQCECMRIERAIYNIEEGGCIIYTIVHFEPHGLPGRTRIHLHSRPCSGLFFPTHGVPTKTFCRGRCTWMSGFGAGADHPRLLPSVHAPMGNNALLAQPLLPLHLETACQKPAGIVTPSHTSARQR